MTIIGLKVTLLLYQETYYIIFSKHNEDYPNMYNTVYNKSLLC